MTAAVDLNRVPLDELSNLVDALEREPVRKFYRFQETRYSGGVIMLRKSEFAVVKDTECGVWLDVYGQRRFCRTDARKRFACPTEQEALESYHARKRRQVRILRAQLASAEAALTLTKDGETAPTSLL